MNPATLHAARAAAAFALQHPGPFRVMLPLDGDAARAARGVLRAVGGVTASATGEHVIADAVGARWALLQSADRVRLSTPVLTGAAGLAQLGAVVRALRGDGVRAEPNRPMGVWLDALDADAAVLQRVRWLVLKHGPLLAHVHGVAWPAELRAVTWRELLRLASGRTAQRSARTAEERLLAVGDTPPRVGLDVDHVASAGVLGFAFGAPSLHSAAVVAHVQLAVGLLHRATVGRTVVGGPKPYSAAAARSDLRLLLVYLGFIGEAFRSQREQMLERARVATGKRGGSEDPPRRASRWLSSQLTSRRSGRAPTRAGT